MTELGYLGDGVYLSFDGYHYWLAANHHERKVVALDPDVFLALVKAVDAHSTTLGDAMRRYFEAVTQGDEG